jgi:nucleoside-diphosphate kinase
MGTVVPIMNAEGKQVGERMDNLIHASATPGEAEREIKLWFKPEDIPPSMRSYETERCEEIYFLKDSRLLMQHESGSFCFLAQGNVAWKSDLDILRMLKEGKQAPDTLESVVAKYLINAKQE